jgi:hypothetical protein
VYAFTYFKYLEKTIKTKEIICTKSKPEEETKEIKKTLSMLMCVSELHSLP